VTKHPGTSYYTIAGKDPPVVAELGAIFNQLPDQELLVQLRGPTRRGPKGHPVETLWRCFIARYVLGLESTAALIRTLTNNPYIAHACGINSPDNIPHEATFSRFFAKLSKPKFLPRVKDVSRSLVRRHYVELPGFGQRVAMDSSTLKAWSNGGKTTKSDSDAGWSVKQNTHGKNEFTWGYKLHLLVDCEYEPPISAHVSSGNVNDNLRASNLLSQARFTHKNFGSTAAGPKYVMADKGYSSTDLIHRIIKNQYRSTAIIQINRGHKKLLAEFGEQQRTSEWKALYIQRQAVERAFSRLKGQRSLNHIRVRRLRKVTAHCYLSLIAMQATASAGRCG